jgi:ubiquitin-protein ligase
VNNLSLPNHHLLSQWRQNYRLEYVLCSLRLSLETESQQMTLKRIHREIADIKKEDLGGIEISPSTDNLFLWNATIPGQEGSPYEGGSFKTEIAIPSDYPCVLRLSTRVCN